MKAESESIEFAHEPADGMKSFDHFHGFCSGAGTLKDPGFPGGPSAGHCKPIRKVLWNPVNHR